jgi:hypothetical protein
MNMKKLHQRVTQITVLPEGEAIFSPRAVVISIDDDAGGEYVKVKTQIDTPGEKQEISIDPHEWPSVREAINRMMIEISDWETLTKDEMP